MANEPVQLAQKLAQRLATDAGLFLVVTPALSDEFDLIDGYSRSWQYIEGHRSYLPPTWWCNAHAPFPNALSWLQSRRIVVGGHPSSWRLCLASRGAGISHRWPMPTDTRDAWTSTLAAHLSVLAEEARQRR